MTSPKDKTAEREATLTDHLNIMAAALREIAAITDCPAPADVDTDALTKALMILARRNVPVHVQELLVYGEPRLNVAPGALRAVVEALTPSPPPTQENGQ
jgi:hypothetical protein